MRGGPGNPDAFRGVLNRFRGQNRGGFGGRGPPGGHMGPPGGGPGGRFMGQHDNFRGDRGRGGFDRRGGRGRDMGRGRGRMR